MKFDAQGRRGTGVPHSLSLSLCGPPGATYWTDSNAKFSPDAYLAQPLEKDVAPGERTLRALTLKTPRQTWRLQTDLRLARLCQSFLPGKAAVVFAAPW